MKFLPIALAATLSIAAPAQAATIVDTGTPAGRGVALYPNQQLAGYFSLTSATVLTDVQGFMGAADNPGDVTIAISEGSDLPSTPLYAGTFASVKAASFQGLSGLNWLLEAGNYWVSFSSTGNNGMTLGAPDPLSKGAFWQNGQWYGEARSEDSLGVRISGVAAAVPEPATWAMMLLGLGMVGAAARRRRFSVRAAVRIA